MMVTEEFFTKKRITQIINISLSIPKNEVEITEIKHLETKFDNQLNFKQPSSEYVLYPVSPVKKEQGRHVIGEK